MSDDPKVKIFCIDRYKIMQDLEKTKPRAARGRPRAFDRTAALDRALDLFWRQGYEATSVSELTAAMGLVPPSLYAAFGSKQQLFFEAVERYQELHGACMTRSLQEAETAREAIARMLREAAAAFSSPATPPGCLVITAATNCSPASADVETALRQRRIVSEGGVRDRIQRGIDDGELPQSVNAASLAKFYATVLQGMSIQARDGASRADLEDVACAAMAIWPGSNAEDDVQD